MQTLLHNTVERVKEIANSDIGPKLYNREKKKITHERLHLKDQIRFQTLYSRPMDKIDSSNFIRELLVTESIHAGHEYNQPESCKKIPEFIKFFELDMSEFERENIEDYKSFNDFFIREIKSDRRPLAEPDDDSVIVSGADCRLMVFNSLQETTDLWIKGEEFSFEKLLGHDKELTETFRNGVLANFRLCPQDYHRFHTPVSGTIGKITKLPGTTYSVEPCDIKSDIDVLGENEREIIIIDAGKYGKVAFVAIGAKKVGLVTTLVKEGSRVKKGDELGYFSFGGSDVVLMFEKRIKWDDDIREHSVQGIETLLKFNQRIGRFEGEGAQEKDEFPLH